MSAPSSTTALKRPERPVAKSKPTPKSTEPSFGDLATELSSAEALAKAATADAGAAKAKRSTVAVQTIRAAVTEKVAIPDVRSTLLDAGVLKGTVSKVATILDGINRGVLVIDDVKSLNGAYSAIKAIAKAGIVAGSGPTAVVGPPPAPKPTKLHTPEDAIKLIVDLLKAEKDPDKQMELAGKYITDFTNAVTAAVREADEEGEGS